MISVTPCDLSRSTMCAMTGRSTTGTMGLGSSYVMGRRRVPSPAARTIAFTPGKLSVWRRARGVRLVGGGRPAGEVLPLLAGELVDLHALGLEREPREVGVDRVRDGVHAVRERA